MVPEYKKTFHNPKVVHIRQSGLQTVLVSIASKDNEVNFIQLQSDTDIQIIEQNGDNSLTAMG